MHGYDVEVTVQESDFPKSDKNFFDLGKSKSLKQICHE